MSRGAGDAARRRTRRAAVDRGAVGAHRTCELALAPPPLARAPYFCSDCPHNSSTQADADELVGAGIGCHVMLVTQDDERAGSVLGLTQMGGEGAQLIGMAPFTERRHLTQNVGDGTFHHSGSLALRAAVAARANITYNVEGVMPVPQLTRLHS
jgi:indolepyruvate ferredoxin oxidoreductase